MPRRFHQTDVRSTSTGQTFWAVCRQCGWRSQDQAFYSSALREGQLHRDVEREEATRTIHS